MLDHSVSELLQKQFNAELHSAYLYLAFASFFEHMSLNGFANWYMVQSMEEMDHAMIIRRYLIDQGESVQFDAIHEVGTDDMGILDVLREAKSHELVVTDMINRLYKEASGKNDQRTSVLLTWFIREQSEEEKNAEEMIQKYLLYGFCNSCSECSMSEASIDFGLCGGGLFSLNRELADRKYSKTAYSFA